MIARLFCWLGFHDWLWVYRLSSVEVADWRCSRCATPAPRRGLLATLIRFIDWITSRSAIRQMWADHNRKMLLLRQARLDPSSVDRDEFRRLWHDEIHREIF